MAIKPPPTSATAMLPTALALGLAFLGLAAYDACADEAMATAEFRAGGVAVWHDDDRSVTCWIYSHPKRDESGISCLPDTQLVLSAEAAARESRRQHCKSLNVPMEDC